jgi:hypothetical protein
VDPEKLKPYYTNLIAKFFPQKLRWWKKLKFACGVFRKCSV